MKDIFKPLNTPCKSGKQHSFKHEEDNKKFAQYLRASFYNVSLSNLDVYELKKKFNNEACK